MKVGLQLYHFYWPGSPEDIGEKIREMARTADDGGFNSIWVMDHFFQLAGGFGPPEAVRYDRPTMESYATLSHIAAATKRVKLGAMVTGNVYRHPGILIKQVTSLDVLSGGRAYLGIGAGWYRREARGLGVPFPESPGERFRRLAETLMIAKRMWSGNITPFKGRYYQLDEPLCSPPPITKPHPPILIGGDGERTLLKLIAKYADACNFHIGGPLEGYPESIRAWYANRVERISRKVTRMGEFCKKQGRSLDEIEVTILATVKVGEDAMSPKELVSLCREMNSLGVQHIIFNMPNAHEIDPLETIANEVIPQVSDI
ncbi:hypothetical protein A3K78_01330 [Candidatus Bathyarchaeota archaeon RBG_13_52_12]|nr:MAG: hypothetical protein A3K78_01330 [Candidatus Bathyarchaeota archaeon RBG_13_52_12]